MKNTWRSIHASRVLVKEGLRWRLGNGSSIRIWRDAWLRNTQSPYLSTTPVEGMHDIQVSSFIDHEHNCWNIDTLRSCLNDRDLKEITAIPLLNLSESDAVYWRFGSSGEYTVRTAYHCIMNNLLDTEHLKAPGEWNLLWQTHVPPKMKHCVWRILRGCIPTRDNLRTRGVNCPNICPFCNEGPENEWHLFFSCPQAQTVWEATSLWQAIQPIFENADGAKELIFNLLHALPPEDTSKFVVSLWCIWRRRNDKVWNNNYTQPHLSMTLAMQHYREWCSARKPCHTQDNNHTSLSPNLTWRPPVEDYLKCNLDAALFTNNNRYGTGICLRDSRGHFIKAKTLCFPGSPEPHEAEAWSLLQALKWVKDMGLQQVCFELDCKQVVDTLSKDITPTTAFLTLLATCRTYLSVIQNSMVSLVRRQANQAAHALARASRSYATPHVFDRIPNCIFDIIMNEMP